MFLGGYIGIPSEGGVNRDGAWHVDGWGKMEVGGIPHLQGRGTVGDISPVCKRPVILLAGGTAHPTCVMDDGL